MLQFTKGNKPVWLDMLPQFQKEMGIYEVNLIDDNSFKKIVVVTQGRVLTRDGSRRERLGGAGPALPSNNTYLGNLESVQRRSSTDGAPSKTSIAEGNEPASTDDILEDPGP